MTNDIISSFRRLNHMRMPTTSPTTSVLFIGGHGRSGSTLLSRLLGRYPSVMSVGDLMLIGSRGLRDDQLCSCGKHFKECDFWSEVLIRVGGRSAEEWFGRLAHLKESLARIRYVPLLASAGRVENVVDTSQVTEYIGMLGEVFAAISALAGVDTIIDSSKYPPYGFFLSKCATLDLYPVHIIRDSRAVAFSQQRKKIRPEIDWTTEFMPRISPARSAFDWTLVNVLMHLLGRTSGRYFRVRYEDLAADAERTAQAAISWSGADGDLLANGTLPSINSGQEHELSGNPMRFQREFKVVPDIEWLSRMAARDRLLTTAISGSLLVRYGYKLGG